MRNLFCYFGLHRWYITEIWEHKSNYGSVYLNGRICWHCGTIHKDDYFQVKELDKIK